MLSTAHNSNAFPASSNAAALWRTAAVVRNRRDVADGADFEAGSRKCADSRLTARSGTAYADIDRTKAVIARLVCGIDRRLLCGKRSTFTRPTEAERARALPRKRIAVSICDGHDGVVKRS